MAEHIPHLGATISPHSSAHLPHPGAIDSFVRARHGDPFSLLGPQSSADGALVRAFLPEANRVQVADRVSGAALGELVRIHPDGLWSGAVASAQPYILRYTVADGAGGETVVETEDPYSFGPLLGELDIYLISEGRHRDLGSILGSHVVEIDGVRGTRFAVWAPNAQRVSVVGSFNNWDGRRNPMRLRQSAGVWELFVPRVGAGALYKYEIVGPAGDVLPWRADPVAWATEVPPQTASRVDDPHFVWTDEDWMHKRAARQAPDAPMSIYEMHAMSWLPHDAGAPGGGYPSWDSLGDRLIPYLTELGFTHVELMPIMEHPFGGSWGYQTVSQFAPTARLGSPEQFARFIDRCHAANLGVVLDWVPAHFPTDAHGLARFDGTPLYEHGNPFEGYHQDWNTYIYNLGRNEVRGFMIASGLFWLRHFHVDGLRVDAVASMLYRDYSRKQGEWVPNQYGGRENLESIAFLQDLSRVVREDAPGAILIAEESTSFPGVSRPADEGGLGFDYKWNMGWMHDTLHYIEEQPVYRRWHHGEISFGLVYAFSEKFVLPISHDEVVYGKGSMIGKMPGDWWQRCSWAARSPRKPSGTTIPGCPGGSLTTRCIAACSCWSATSTGCTSVFRHCMRATATMTGSAGWRCTMPTRACSRGCGSATGDRHRCSWCATSRRCRATTTSSACRRPGTGRRSSTRTVRVMEVPTSATAAASRRLRASRMASQPGSS